LSLFVTLPLSDALRVFAGAVVVTNSTISSLEAVISSGVARFDGITVSANAYLTVSFGGSGPSMSALVLQAPCGLLGPAASPVARAVVDASTFDLATDASIVVSRYSPPSIRFPALHFTV
jgi:hypothetical protein